MDEYLIIEFSTEADAETALASVNTQIEAILRQNGYTVTDGGVVGKNAATGQNEPSATQTTTWDMVQQSPDGTFYFSSPHNDTRFSGVTITGGTEIPFPETWRIQGEI